MESDNSVYIFWKFLHFSSKLFIFMLVGIIAGLRVFTETIKTNDWYNALYLYLALMIIRALQLLAVFPLLRYWNHGIKFGQMVLLFHCCLRNYITIALALILFETYEID